MHWATLSMIGFLTGGSSAFFGIGGSAVLIPALLLIGRYEQKRASVTTIAVSLPAVFVGLATYGGLREFAWQGVIPYLNFWYVLMVGAVAGTFLGAYLLKRLRNIVLTATFACVLIAVGLRMAEIIPLSVHPASGSVLWTVLAATGFLAGTGNALLGIGGGAVLVPGLYLFGGLTAHQAVVMSLAVIGPTAIISLLQHRGSKLVHTDHVWVLIPAALTGAVAGAIFGDGLSGPTLTKTFGIFLVGFGIWTALRELSAGQGRSALPHPPPPSAAKLPRLLSEVEEKEEQLL